MYDIIDKLHWTIDEGSSPILATLVDISGSAVRGRGATMVISSDRRIEGSLSGGCIESAVIQTADRVHSSGSGELLSFCPVEDELFGSFSPCGGELSVYVYPAAYQLLEAVRALHKEGKPLFWALSTEGKGQFVGESLDQLTWFPGASTSRDFSSEIAAGEVRELSQGRNLKEGAFISSWFLITLPAPTSLAIVGGGHISRVLAEIGKSMGWNCTVIEPRDVFADQEQLPEGVTLLRTWPEPAFRELGIGSPWALAALTHDQKIDDQALMEGLKGKCFYTGVLGSRKTVAERKKRLAQMGIEASLLDRIDGPIGIDIGAASPEEIALSVAAQIVQRLRRR
jgi:xanthine dehydrogenase accessory factor